MAQEQANVQTKTPWTKIFTAFKVALDVKKLVLAAVGIFCMAIGWWVIGWVFYNTRSFPEWKNYENKENPDTKAQWAYFKAKRASWNLLYELAGPTSEPKPYTYDAADLTDQYEVFELLRKWEEAYNISVSVREKTLEVGSLKYTVTPVDEQAKARFSDLQGKPLTIRSLANFRENGDKKTGTILVENVMLNVLDGDLEKLRTAIDSSDIKTEASKAKDQKTAQTAFKIFQGQLINPKIKPSGKLRGMPWFEDRGRNPYLIVSEAVESPKDFAGRPGKFFDWLLTEQAPVVLEPLFKFFLPIVYFFDARAGWWDRVYLVFILICTLAVWGFFGGAICRIAAVQVARNERISLAEAIHFTRERFTSYAAAPVFPLILVAIFMFLLMIFGWIEWIPWLGDIFAGLLWPVPILLGFIMAIVLVGLVGWPLMIATVSVEGNDSFDALSRSYSYVYQAPWQYLWYTFLAIVYGAVLVFFVGFMASLMVFLGKWGVASAPGPAAYDRDPAYLFYYAPTSFGWKDLLISGNQHVVTKIDVLPSGRTEKHLAFSSDYEKALSGWNLTGSVLVQIWLWPFFLLVVGFGYSFFFSASTIIYFLMRHQVDDTDLDEVHMEDEELEDPFMKPAPAAPAPPPPASKPGVVSLNVVDAPPPATSIRAEEPPSAAPAPAGLETPPAATAEAPPAPVPSSDGAPPA